MLPCVTLLRALCSLQVSRDIKAVNVSDCSRGVSFTFRRNQKGNVVSPERHGLASSHAPWRQGSVLCFWLPLIGVGQCEKQFLSCRQPMTRRKRRQLLGSRNTAPCANMAMQAMRATVILGQKQKRQQKRQNGAVLKELSTCCMSHCTFKFVSFHMYFSLTG